MMQRLADSIPAAVFIFQGNKNRWVNSAAEALTGYSRRELLKMDFWQILHPDYQRLVMERGLARQNGVPVSRRYEVKIVRKDGQERWLDFTGAAIKYQRRTAVVGTAIDITERKRAQEQVQQNLNRLRALHEANLATTSTLDLKNVLDLLLENIERSLSFPLIAILRIRNPQTGALEAKALRNFTEADWQRVSARNPHSIDNGIFDHGGPVRITEAGTDPRTRNLEFFKEFGFASYLGVPVIINGKVLGEISLFTREIHGFSNDEVEFVSTLAAQAAMSIQNSKLYEGMKNQASQLSALNALITATTQSLDLNSVTREAAQSIVQLFQFDGAWIYLFNESMDEVELKAAFETDPGTWFPAKVTATGKGIVGRVAKTGEMVIFEDIQNNPRYDELTRDGGAKKAGAKSFAAFPIRSRHKSWGALACIGKKSRRLGVEEIDLLITFCNQVAIAIENATLFQQTAEKAKELSALYSVAAISGQFLDLNTLLYQSMCKVLEIFGFTAGRIYLLDHQTRAMQLVAQEGFPGNVTPTTSYRIGEGLIGRVIDSGAPLVFADMQKDSEYHRLARAKTLSRAGFRASFFVPLRARGETLGVMNVFHRQPHAFSASEIQLINSIAYHLGIAIGNAKFFSQLRKKTVDLEKANKAKDEFLSVVSHELRTPLNVIQGYVRLISAGKFGILTPELENAVAKVTNQTGSLLTMVDDILVTTRLEAGAVRSELSEVQLADFLVQLKSSYDLASRDEFCMIWNIASDLPILRTDFGKLKQILQNLINNAIKFTDKGHVTISARHVPEAKVVEFAVEDTGIGIEPEKIPLIFEMFHQLDSSDTRAYGGVGLGLYIVKKFTELLGGTVKAESEFGKGSLFTLTIPLD